jgi:hypothetical protein
VSHELTLPFAFIEVFDVQVAYRNDDDQDDICQRASQAGSELAQEGDAV